MRKKAKAPKMCLFLMRLQWTADHQTKPPNFPLKMVKTQELDAQDFCTAQHSRVLFLW